MFYLVALTVFSLMHIYVGRRLISDSRYDKKTRRLAWWAIAAIFSVQLFGMLVYRNWLVGTVPFWVNGLMWLTYGLMGLMVLLLLLFIARDIVRLLSFLYIRLATKKALPETEDKEADPSRRAFLGGSASLGILGIGAGLSGMGFLGATRPPRIEKVDLPFIGLPVGLEGYRIVQLTDMHIGPTLGREFVEDVVEKVQSLKPDMIVMTGDMVDGWPMQLEHGIEPLSRLYAPDGMFWVTGNHEYYWGVRAWIEISRHMGFEPLINQHRLIKRHGARLLVAGVTDYQGGRFIGSHASDPAKALTDAPRADLKLLLAHQPLSCYEAEKAGFDLQLSGHTHGGQFIPWNYFVLLQQPYVSGLHKHGRMLVYVSRGVGYWGPPVRLGVPAEISLLTLRGV